MNKLKTKSFEPALYFLLPALLGFVLFYVAPFFISLAYSFLTKPVNGEFAGVSNYAELFKNPTYQKALANTLWFIGVSVPLNMLISLGTAMLINKSGKLKAVFVFIFLIPLVIPSGATVFFWEMLFSQNGYLNGIITALGGAKADFLNTDKARFVIVFIFIWKNMGYNMVLFTAGLNNISKSYYEAAETDGAGAIKKFIHITLANLMPTTVLVLIMSVINSFKVFKEIYLIMGNYPHESVYTLQHFMNNMFVSLNYQKLTTATTVLVLLIAALALFLMKWERKLYDG